MKIYHEVIFMTLQKDSMITSGRPRKKIDKETLISLFNEYHRWDLVAENLGVSIMTVYRRLKEYNLNKQYTWIG